MNNFPSSHESSTAAPGVMTSSAPTTTVNPTVIMSANVALALGITLSFLMVVGLLGNISAICVYMSSRRLRLPQNAFVVSLAVTDCVMVLSAPIVIANLHSEALHQSTGACLAVVLAFRLASSLGMVTIAAIGIVRYLSIVHPKTRAAVFTWARCVTGVVAVWVYAGSLTSLLLLPRVSSYAYNPQMFLCLVNHSNQAYNITTVVLIYVLSVLLLAYSYSRIYATVRQSSRRIHTTVAVSSVTGTRLNGDARKKEWLRMADETRLAIQLMLIFVVFVVCWSPYLLTSALIHGVLHWSLPQPVYNFFLVSILFNSAVNPIIYLCYNRVYREELLHRFLIICCYWSRRPNQTAPAPPQEPGCRTSNVVGVSTGRGGVVASVPVSDFRSMVVSSSAQRVKCQSSSIECEDYEPRAGQPPSGEAKHGAGEKDQGPVERGFGSTVKQETILETLNWRRPQSINIVFPG